MPDISLRLLNDSTMADPGTTETNWMHSKITWTIADSRIITFKIVPKYPDEKNPFLERLNPKFDKIQKAQTAMHFKERIWEYNIEWTNAKGEEKVFDPKIAIKPGVSYLLIGFAIILIAIPLTKYFAKKIRHRK